MAEPSSRRGRPPHAQPGGGLWSTLSPTARHGAILAVFAILSISFFAPAVFDGKGVHGGDVVNWRGGAEAMIEYQESTGGDALWAPNMFGGMPGYLVNYDTEVPQVDTLVNQTRSVLWPASHFFVLLVGVYLLVFYLTEDQFAGLASAAAYGLTTYIPILLAAGHQTKFLALVWAPYVLLAFAYALRNPSWLSGLLFAAALSVELRAKHPQITYYVLMLALVWWIVEGVRAYRDDALPPFARSTGFLAFGTGLGLLMVVQPYWATYEYKQFSTRAANTVAGGGDGGGAAMAWDYAMRWSQGVKELVTLAVADAFGGGGSRTYWGPKTFTAGPHYVGGGVLVLAILAVWKVRTRITWGLVIGALTTALFALGKHFALLNRPMFEVFPFFDAFRAPETWLSVTALALCVLAGVGLHYLLSEPEADSRRKQAEADAERSRALYTAFGVAFGVVLLLLVGRSALFDFEKPNERQRFVQAIQQQRPDLDVQSRQVQQFIRQQIEERKEERASMFTSDAYRTLIVLGVLALLLWLYRRETLAPWLAGTLVALVLVVDLWGVAKRYLNEEAYSPTPDIEQVIETRHTRDVDRWVKERKQEAGGLGHFRVLPLASNPMNNATTAYHYESVGGYHGAKLQVYQDYIDHILQISQGRLNENALDLLSTRYLISRRQIPGTRVAHRGDQSGLLVLENPDALPRAFFVGQAEVVSDPEQTWQRLRSRSFNPRRTALLSENLDRQIAPIDSASTTRVELQSFTPPKIRWTVETDAPRLFVASEIYYPAGWNAYLDGEPVPIHRVNYLLRGVHVPAGEHELVMRFEPTADRIGTWVSAVATLATYGGIAALVGAPYIRRRFGEEQPGAGPRSDEREDDG